MAIICFKSVVRLEPESWTCLFSKLPLCTYKRCWTVWDTNIGSVIIWFLTTVDTISDFSYMIRGTTYNPGFCTSVQFQLSTYILDLLTNIVLLSLGPDTTPLFMHFKNWFLWIIYFLRSLSGVCGLIFEEITEMMCR